VDRRHVLLVGVGRFDPVPLDDRREPSDVDDYGDLLFVQDRVDELKAVFAGYSLGGFDVDVVVDGGKSEIAAAVDAFFDDHSVQARILHVISHGHPGRDNRVEVVPRDRRLGMTNVTEWVSRAESESGGQVPTLLLVDLCFAGNATRIDFRHEPDEDELCAWVLAGSGAAEVARDGLFTKVLAAVLRECGVNGLDMAPSEPFVSLAEIGRRVGDVLKRSGQSLTSTKRQIHHRVHTPFFHNPRWRDDPAAKVRALVDPGVRPFWDDAVAGADHFQDRAGLFFTGRESYLDELIPWLSMPGSGGLWVVTGAAGAGKSALLGALVCAAHPALAASAEHVRVRLPERVSLATPMAAVHARQRSLDEIVASIARQLNLDEPRGGWTTAALVEAIAAMACPPAVVVDALDECPQWSAVQSLLLLPLSSTRRDDGTAACRLLVGTRPWEQFRPILQAGRSAQRSSDLDVTDPRQLRKDLRRYVLDVLADMPLRERLADGVANRLAADHEQRMGEPVENRWGHFLVASRYAQYLLDHPASDETHAASLVESMPVTLPDVLELELAEHPDAVQIRAVLATLALAKGEGMPAQVVQDLVSAFGSSDASALTGPVVKLYVRTSTEATGIELYRLYHQGLADYLRDHPRSRYERMDLTRPLLRALRDSRNTAAGDLSWQYAPPYLLRHAIHHGVDAGQVDVLVRDGEFLVHADPVTLVPELDHAVGEDARIAAAVYRASYHLFGDDPQDRRRLLHLNALRYGASSLVSALPWTVR
jgi:hypothetical protein